MQTGFLYLEDRSYVTGDFGGNLAVWDLEEERPVEEVAGAHSEMINCVTGTEGGRVVTSASPRTRDWRGRMDW